jgi:hypothetical protein
MAALGFLGRPDAMAALTSILPGVMADINKPAEDDIEDMYD